MSPDCRFVLDQLADRQRERGMDWCTPIKYLFLPSDVPLHKYGQRVKLALQEAKRLGFAEYVDPRGWRAIPRQSRIGKAAQRPAFRLIMHHHERLRFLFEEQPCNKPRS